MEQFAIEASEMFKKGLVTLDDAVDTPAEAEAKAKAAARRKKVVDEEDEIEDTKQVKKTTKK
jgi:hypothetical protein